MKSRPTIEQLQDLLDRIITRIMKLLTHQGYLTEEAGTTGSAGHL